MASAGDRRFFAASLADRASSDQNACSAIRMPGQRLPVRADTKMTTVEQTLLLPHQASKWVSEDDLLKSIEYSNPSLYRSNVLVRLHKTRKIEYDKAGKRAHISPTGSKYIEALLIAPRMGIAK